MVNVFKSEEGKRNIISSYNSLLKSWGVDYIEKDVETTFGITHCLISGNPENPPLLMFHGVGDNSAVMWALNIGSLSEQFYCIAVDTLGGPGKSLPNGRFVKNSFTQRAWINEIVDYFGLKKINIIGVSNGAAMAYNYLTKESARINKVVCLEGGIVTNPIMSIFSTIGMMFPEILFPTKENMTKVLKKLCSPNSGFIDKQPQIVNHMILVMKNHNQKAMFVHEVERYKREEGQGVREKVLFLFGDRFKGQRKKFYKLLEDDGFCFKLIQNAGHGINHEQPEVVNGEIIRYLET